MLGFEEACWSLTWKRNGRINPEFLRAKTMSEEGDEEWDADFSHNVFEAVDRFISSQHPRPPLSFSEPQPPPPPQEPQPPVHFLPPSHSDEIRAATHSPPRELSQRKTNAISLSSSNGILIPHSPPRPPSSSALPPYEPGKDLQIHRLKEELSQLRKECSELKKERDKKDEQLKFATSVKEEKDAAARRSESANLFDGGRESGEKENHEVSRQLQNVICSSDQPGSRINIGIQTDVISASARAIPNDDLHTYDDLSKKLLAIWGPPNEQELGRNLIYNLLMACQTDFHFLFGCIGMHISSKLRMDKLGDDSSSIAASQYHLHMSHTPEAAKVSHLYSVFTKVKNGMLKLEALFQPLFNLCSTENVMIVQAALHILHVFLKHLFDMERQFKRRDNVMVGGLHSKNDIVYPPGSEGGDKGPLFCVSMNQTSYGGSHPHGMKFSYAEAQSKNGVGNNGIATWISCIDWISLFDVILQTAMKNTGQGVRLEAVSIMNMIIMRSNGFMEREKFGQAQVFKTLSHLLAKEVGLEVRKQAVQLLYMLLNCPKILVKFSSEYKEGKGAGAMDGNVGDGSAYQKICMILQGLADCIACCGNGLEELKLRRNAVILLAFLASSGKSGFEILVSHKLFQGANFLMLILQVLAMEVDTEAAVNADQAHVFKERTLLIREALILLNRLVSHPAYSVTILRLLTNSRDMASLTIDVANRLSRKDRICQKFDGMARQMRESEVVDLARVFKKRVFTYLGDNIS